MLLKITLMIPDLRDPAFIGALVHFDEAAKSLSFATAARVLGVTPSAVSHRIARLEKALGKPLFERETRRVSLTQEGLELAEATRAAMDHLRKATQTLAKRRLLRVSVPTYLSTAWLMPRLAEFEQRRPGLRIDLLHRTGLPDLRHIDIAILWANAPPPELRGTILFDTDCIPVAAPGVMTGKSLWASAMPPLHYRDRTLWRHWLAAVGAPAGYADRGEVFDDPLLVLEAAAHRRGIAMGFLPFVTIQIEAGRLVRAHHHAIRSQQSYWIVLPDEANPSAAQFRDWVLQCATSG